MAKEKTMAPQRTILSMPPELKEAIRAFRFSKQINTEAEAIRALLVQALEANGIKVREPKG